MSLIPMIINGRKSLYRQPRNHLLDINVISAQDLQKNLNHKQLYAVVWAYPDDRQPTQIKYTNKEEAAWNEQFVVRVDDMFLRSETSAITVGVYSVGNWFRFGRDHFLGSTRIVVSTVLNHSRQNVALQIREPKTLEPCGVLNITISLLVSGCNTPTNSGNYATDREIISNAPLSCSMRFDSKHKIDEDIEYAFIENRRIVDKSGPIEKMEEQEQTERKNLESKIEQWKIELCPGNQMMENSRRRINRSMSHINLRGFRFCLCGSGTNFEA